MREAVAEDAVPLYELSANVEEAPHWPLAAWEAIFRGEGAERIVLVAVAENEVNSSEEILGLAVLTLVSDFAELESIAVAPKRQRQGIGGSLLVAGIVSASARGAQSLELEVRASNERARKFYQTRGFREQGRRAAYYSDPVEDAVLMELRPLKV
ncbi:GNAT family N-acetyltransferase [Granulicella cerasi]|uniref:GNAT family N-acetyltransferase n=1 Tax=Granulicella cerasi TaxID=741063 RepID=UPI0021E0CE71|nr:GNAT family N-acetyltransferase [Granulicella cerasi]